MTGTSTDAVVVAATGTGPRARFGGPASELGWVVARAAGGPSRPASATGSSRIRDALARRSRCPLGRRSRGGGRGRAPHPDALVEPRGAGRHRPRRMAACPGAECLGQAAGLGRRPAAAGWVAEADRRKRVGRCRGRPGGAACRRWKRGAPSRARAESGRLPAGGRRSRTRSRTRELPAPEVPRAGGPRPTAARDATSDPTLGSWLRPTPHRSRRASIVSTRGGPERPGA